jgi:hypothetical protein
MYYKICLICLIFINILLSNNLPDTNKTPGNIVPGIMLMELCNKCFLDKQPISNNTIKKVAENYKIPISDFNKYTFDCLIPVSLGGSSEIKNVWPIDNKLVWKKHVLDSTLNWLVCNAQIDVKEARKIIVSNWIFAYKFYCTNTLTK